MMKVHFHYKLNRAQQIEWLQFWANCEHSHPRQHLMFAEIERAKGRTPVFIIGEEDGKIVAIGIFSIRPLFLGKKFSFEAFCLRGPTFDNIDHGRYFLLQTISFFKSLNVGSIRLSPSWYFPGAEPVESLLTEMNLKPYFGGTRDATGLIDLQRNIDEIFASFSQSTRREIRRAERQHVIIRAATNLEEGRYFFDKLDLMQHERGLTPIPFDEFCTMMESIFIKQDVGVLLNAYHDETFLGGLWLIRSPRFTHASRYVVANDALRKLSNLSIGPILWLHGMMWAKDKGCKFFDMEGSVEAKDINSITYEVEKFKKRFSPIAIERINEHIYICNSGIQSIFKGHIRIKQIKSRVSSLPYYIAKKLAPRIKKHDTNNK